MPQSLARIYLHLIFSTKNRAPFISAEIEPELHRYLGGVAAQHECAPVCVGGVADHVHVGCELARTVAVASLVAEIKRSSSIWVKERFAKAGDFEWQKGYGAFSVGHSQLDRLRRYVGNQREHHRKVSFQEEYRDFLRKYGVAFDEKYVWD